MERHQVRDDPTDPLDRGTASLIRHGAEHGIGWRLHPT